MVRNYAKTIEQVTGKNPQAGPREYHDWSVAEFDAIVAAGGPKSYERQHAQPVAPQPVYEMATNPGHQLTTQAQPAAPAFQDVATAPAAIVPRFAVIDGGLSAPVPAIPTAAPIVPMGQVGGQILQTTASAQAATQAVGQMIGALKQRMTLGADVLYAQDVQSTQQLESLETQLAELQAMASEYDRAARVQSVKESMRADRVGKLTDQVAQTAARLGFGLQPLSS
ncbi:hypothetical protein H6F48_18715 [Limnothrix sp. FACHB-1088]|uniref:hypothetical protein n=1 Tax=Limnothrix sp. FACHB-1088 TaxID=2692816 RepID=UPI001680C4F6|nr:hypothetical protein [Limnothrix sp. FACHB-1088]MBD2193830.1 hypothetical protein [Limnothrix sp. FACHB-1088]